MKSKGVNQRSQGVTLPLIRRMAVLRRAGLSYEAIAAVVKVDNPSVEIGFHSVYYYLKRYGPESPSGLATCGMTTRGNPNFGAKP